MLDVKTLLFAMFLSMVLGSVALFFFALINRNSKSLWLWTISQAAEALGAVFFMLRDTIPEPLSILMGNGLVLGGFLFVMLGVLVFFEKPAHRMGFPLLVWSAAMLGISWYTFVTPDFATRAIISAIALSVFIDHSGCNSLAPRQGRQLERSGTKLVLLSSLLRIHDQNSRHTRF